VTHCGLCGSDVHLWQSDGGYKDFTAWAAGKDAQICGHEVIGEVTAVGSAVTHVKPGDRAGVGWQNGACHNCEWCLRGDEQLCGSVSCTCCEGNEGGFADYIRVKDGGFVYPIPDACDAAATAPLLCGGQTVWTPLRQQTKAGDRVGILGLGGLGTMAVTFAKALGCEVTALSSSDSKKAQALALGATGRDRSRPRWTVWTRRDGRDAVASTTGRAGLDALAPTGRPERQSASRRRRGL